MGSPPSLHQRRFCVAGAQKARRQIIKSTIMKKMIMLAAAMGFAAALTAAAADAKANWDNSCAKCHGADGRGQTKIGQKIGARDYSDPKVQASFTDAEAFKATKEGLKDKNGNIQMKAYSNFSDDEIKALVDYMRTFKK